MEKKGVLFWDRSCRGRGMGRLQSCRPRARVGKLLERLLPHRRSPRGRASRIQAGPGQPRAARALNLTRRREDGFGSGMHTALVDD